MMFLPRNRSRKLRFQMIADTVAAGGAGLGFGAFLGAGFLAARLLGGGFRWRWFAGGLPSGGSFGGCLGVQGCLRGLGAFGSGLVVGINSSIRRTILDGGTFNTPAIPTKTRIVGLLIPRSIRLMYVRSNPPSRASRSWEISLPSRISRRGWPTAFSGPGSGWICLRGCLTGGCANSLMLLR